MRELLRSEPYLFEAFTTRSAPSWRCTTASRRSTSDGADIPTRSHHLFSGVPYHHRVGKMYDSTRLGREFVEELPEDKVV